MTVLASRAFFAGRVRQTKIRTGGGSVRMPRPPPARVRPPGPDRSRSAHAPLHTAAGRLHNATRPSPLHSHEPREPSRTPPPRRLQRMPVLRSIRHKAPPARSPQAEGVAKWGNVPFLIKRVAKADTVEQAPALVYGLIHACAYLSPPGPDARRQARFASS